MPFPQQAYFHTSVPRSWSPAGSLAEPAEGVKPMAAEPHDDVLLGSLHGRGGETASQPRLPDAAAAAALLISAEAVFLDSPREKGLAENRELDCGCEYTG